MNLTTVATCHRCGVLAEGDPEAADKAGEKHTRKGHPTATVTTPQAR